jgi:hypothetical protein
MKLSYGMEIPVQASEATAGAFEHKLSAFIRICNWFVLQNCNQKPNKCK